MQIHELNTYSGAIDSGSFLALDNGNDTGKISADAFLAHINEEIVLLGNDLNGRIDNIIAGGDAPSEAEIIDARRGGNGKNYASLGDAIRGQFDQLDSDLQYKADSIYGGTIQTNSVLITGGKMWSSEYGTLVDLVNRAASQCITVRKSFISLDTAVGYEMTVFGNDAGEGNALEVISDYWTTTFDLTTVTKKYIYVAVRKSNNADITGDDLTNVLQMSIYSQVLPFALEQDLDSANEKIEILPYKVGFLEKEWTLYNRAEGSWSEVDTTFGPTRRWFFDYIFRSGDTVTSIDFENYKITPQVVYFEIWEKDGDDLTKVETVTQNTDAQTIYTTPINYTGTSEFMIALLTPVGTVVSETAPGNYMLVSTDVTPETDELTYSSLSTFPKYAPGVNIHVKGIRKNNIILIGESQKYTEIQEALWDITDDTVDNPYTLILLPRDKPYAPFSMLRDLFSDTYPWSGKTPRNISIIGLDKAHCIIRSDTGNYQTPCGEPMTNGVIKNITFIMTHDEQDPAAAQGGYCLHIDSRTLNDIGYKMTIEDCDFENNSGPCLGIGMHENCYLTIKRCNLKTTLEADYNPHVGYRNLYDFGVIFAHTSTLANAQNQHISIEDCVGSCAEGDKSLWISTAGSYDPTTAEFVYRLIRNVFWNITANSSAYSISNTLTADPMNFGNNNA